jgi:hypothetical protein
VKGLSVPLLLLFSLACVVMNATLPSSLVRALRLRPAAQLVRYVRPPRKQQALNKKKKHSYSYKETMYLQGNIYQDKKCERRSLSTRF